MVVILDDTRDYACGINRLDLNEWDSRDDYSIYANVISFFVKII